MKKITSTILLLFVTFSFSQIKKTEKIVWGNTPFWWEKMESIDWQTNSKDWNLESSEEITNGDRKNKQVKLDKYNDSGMEMNRKKVNRMLTIEHRSYEKEVLTLSREIVLPRAPYYIKGYKFDNDETIFKFSYELWGRIKKQANLYDYNELYDVQAQMQECWKNYKSVCNIN